MKALNDAADAFQRGAEAGGGPAGLACAQALRTAAKELAQCEEP